MFAPRWLSIIASKFLWRVIIKTLYNMIKEKWHLYYIRIYWLSKLQDYKLIFAPLWLSIFCSLWYINSPKLMRIICWKIYVVNGCILASGCLLHTFCSAQWTMSINHCSIYLVERKFFVFSKLLNLLLLLAFLSNGKNIFQLQVP